MSVLGKALRKAALVASALAGASLLGAGGSFAESPAVTGPMSFDPIPGSAYGQLTDDWGEEPFLIPQGYRQYLVSDETADLGGGAGLDIYAGADDLTDMNTTNETGKRAGRYLHRTHEVGNDGAVSVIDLETGGTQVFAREGGPQDRTQSDWRRLDGLRWTPWGTLLFAEETDGGHLFEAFPDPSDPSKADAVFDMPQVGRLRHEGIETAPDGSVFVVDELNGGSIYRFVPSSPGDLSEGQLYALKVRGLTDAQQAWNSGHPRTGAFDWVPLDMEQVVVDADAAANAVHATEYGRPEDVERIGPVLYVALTTEDRVIAIDLAKGNVATFVQAGLNAPVENQGQSVTGFNNPDNLAEGPDGRLWIVEDNDASDIWAAAADGGGDGAADAVFLFASLKDADAEGTGIYFGRDPRTLFVNVQHTAADRDGTWAITNR